MPELAAHLERAKEVIYDWHDKRCCPEDENVCEHCDSVLQRLVAAALAACAREEAEPLLKYAIHKNTCKGFPAFSEAQLALDCNCGLQAIKTRLRALERAVGEKADTKA